METVKDEYEKEPLEKQQIEEQKQKIEEQQVEEQQIEEQQVEEQQVEEQKIEEQKIEEQQIEEQQIEEQQIEEQQEEQQIEEQQVEEQKIEEQQVEEQKVEEQQVEEQQIEEQGQQQPASCAEQRTSVFEGRALQTYMWKPEGDIKALMCLCHGIHEYMGRYEELGNFLKDNGILMFGIDLVGHGRSEGLCGHVDSIHSYVADVLSYMEDMKSSYPSLPLFLMGHSMGGLVSVIATLQKQDILTGLLLSSPYLFTDENPLLKAIGKVVSYVAPKLGVKQLDYHLISSIPKEAEEYNNDPLNIRMKVRAGIGISMLDAVTEIQTRFHEITLPLFIMHGTADRIVLLAGSDAIHTAVSSTDKTLELFPESFHEILHDKDRLRARKMISDWIVDRLCSSSS